MFYLQQSVLNRIAFVLPSQMHKSVLRQAKRLLHNLTLYYHTLFQFLQLPKRRRWYHPLNHHTLLETESPLTLISPFAERCPQIGRASCREREKISGNDTALNKKN